MESEQLKQILSMPKDFYDMGTFKSKIQELQQEIQDFAKKENVQIE